MNDLIIKLNELGCDTLHGLKRVLNDENLYLELVKEALESNKYHEIEEASKLLNWEKVFSLAHALKGVVGNLSLNKLYKIIFDIVEEVRDNNPTNDIFILIKEMIDLKNEMLSVFNSNN